MTHDLPYTTAYGKIGQLFDRISKAKIPDAFTVKYLNQSIGLKSTNDRSLIPLLKKLGFVDAAGKPTKDFSRLKNGPTAKIAIAEGINRAYAPLYEANESAHTLPPEELKGLIAQVSGAEESLIRFIVGTLNNLVKLADFSESKEVTKHESEEKEETDAHRADQHNAGTQSNGGGKDGRSEFKPDFRFNIEIHLPSNGTEETYLAIFNALRKSLG